MTLKKKLVVLLLAAGFILVFLLQTAFLLTIRPSLEEQKHIFIEKLRKRIRFALSMDPKNIAVQCANWAEWDTMSNYLEFPNREFEAEAFPDLIFKEDLMDVVVVVHPQKDILFYKGYKDETFMDLEEMNIAGDIDKIKRMIIERPRVVSTYINSGCGPLMLIANPVFKKDANGQLMGILILGQFMDQGILDRLSSYILEEIHTFPFDQKQVKTFFEEKMKGNEDYFTEEKDRLTVYYLLRDIDEEPAMVLFILSDYKLFRVVNQHVLTFIIITFLSIIFFGLFLYYSIEKYIVKRMINISRSMNKIESLDDLSTRIQGDKNRDEISDLINNINLTLDKLNHEKLEREKAERTMITQEKLVSIGRLASCISHEVNNPLLAISNSIEVIKKISKNKSPVYKEAIEITESEIKRIRNIICSLLDFHRMDTEEFSLISVKSVLLQALNVLKWSKPMDRIHLVQEIDENLITMGSAVRLQQVFLNFMGNAVEAMFSRKDEEESVLQVRVDAPNDDQFLDIHFIDNGPGLPQEVKSHLFEPFVTTKATKGVGLGLYISYKIIDHHHGKIIYNDHHKSGTHFIIKLPKHNINHQGVQV